MERPNRFVIRCRIDNTKEEVTAHLADPGRLKELLLPGRAVWLLENGNPKRKTRWTAILCANEKETGLVSINTSYPNKLIEKVLRERGLEELSGWSFKKAEYTLGDSRWDFLMENEGEKQLLLEVKSVTLAQGEKGMFPDAVTARGAKHVQELASYAKAGMYETAILFVVQREDITYVTPAIHIDPKFARALKEASTSGVRLLSRNCHVTVEEIVLGERIPVVVDDEA